MEKKSFWNDLYPMTKIWIGLNIIILIFAATNYTLSAIIFAVFTSIVCYLGIFKYFKFILISMLILGASLFTIQGILNPDNVTPLFSVFGISWLTFYKEGLILAGNLYCRILPLAPCIFLLIKTTNMTNLGVALNQSGVSYKFNYILVSTFQIIPVFQKEMSQITNAQRARGLVTEGNIIQRAKAFVPIIVPLIANSISKVQSKAIALESKGFNAPVQKTFYREVSKRKIDTVLTVIAFCVGMAGLFYRLALVMQWV